MMIIIDVHDDAYKHRIYLNRPEDSGLNIGSHAKPVSCMEYSRELNSLVTGGWDGHVHVWYVREEALYPCKHLICYNEITTLSFEKTE